jgi:Cu2+-exporting ATPase
MTEHENMGKQHQHGEHQMHEGHDNHNQHDAHNGHGMDHGGHEGHGVDHTGHEIMFRNRFWLSLALTVPILLFSEMLQQWFGFSMPTFPGSQWIGPIFSVIVFVVGGLPFLRMAVPEVRRGKPGMMLLISLAISVAFVFSLAAVVFNLGKGFFWEMATLIDVMLLGHWFEMRSVRQASGALDELAKLMPDTAERVKEDGSTEEVKADELSAGDLVLVRPGGSVPADGEVAEGSTSINEAMITGESKPVDKAPDDEVIGGTVNEGGGSLRVRVTATGDDTALAGIMRLVKEAQGSKSETQLLADKAAGWLFYVALSVAAITAVAWIIAIGFQVDVLLRVVTVLVIACPHALGLAIPLVVAISTTLGARNGILVRDRLALEEARELDVVMFDKTGTLTEGEFGVVDMATVDEWSDDDALALAAAVEGDSEHLLARAIRGRAEEKGLDRPAVGDFEAIKGKGIRATHEGRAVYVGGPRLLEQMGAALPDTLQAFADESGGKGQTVVYLFDEREPVAAFALADKIRPESHEAVEKLRAMGLEVAMITGDSEEVAKAVAEELGIDTVFAEVLPENKDQNVKQLQGEGKRVAMVGDGVNDAPALTRADVGIAIGSGTDVAVESAGIILVKSNPLDIVRIVKLSRETYKKMIQNLIWAAGYNVVALPLAAGALAWAGVLLSPAVGALLMSLSTVIVAINAQLLRRADLTA